MQQSVHRWYETCKTAIRRQSDARIKIIDDKGKRTLQWLDRAYSCSTVPEIINEFNNGDTRCVATHYLSYIAVCGTTKSWTHFTAPVNNNALPAKMFQPFALTSDTDQL